MRRYVLFVDFFPFENYNKKRFVNSLEHCGSIFLEGTLGV